MENSRFMIIKHEITFLAWKRFSEGFVSQKEAK